MYEGASVFIGLGFLVLFSVMAYWLYQASRAIKGVNDLEDRYILAEIVALDKVLLKKGIDLEKETTKRGVMNELRNKRSFRKELRNKAIEEYFGK